MTPRLTVTIDGIPHTLPDGITILDALRAAGAEVPHLCHDDRLAPVGACRMCIVRVAGQPRPVASCTTPLADGMTIETRTDELESLRTTNLSLAAAHYPRDAMANAPELPFHRLLAKYNPVATRPSPAAAAPYHDDTHPLLGLDMNRCIDCYRCVRICTDVQGADVWQVWGRGPETHVAPREHLTLLEAGCVSCGACADTCPTGARYARNAGPAPPASTAGSAASWRSASRTAG